MTAIREIEIHGKPRKALFTISLWNVLQKEGIRVDLKPRDDDSLQSMLSAACEFIKLIYAALRNAVDYGLEDNYPLTLLDVDLWATENKQEFIKIIPFVTADLHGCNTSDSANPC